MEIKIPSGAGTTPIHMYIISTQTHSFTSFTKTPQISENMTTPHDFTTNTGWGHADNKKYLRKLFVLPLNTHCRTNNLHRHPDQLKPSEASLFDLLPKDILTDIESNSIQKPSIIPNTLVWWETTIHMPNTAQLRFVGMLRMSMGNFQ